MRIAANVDESFDLGLCVLYICTRGDCTYKDKYYLKKDGII
jgi:hypothetical protein